MKPTKVLQFDDQSWAKIKSKKLPKTVKKTASNTYRPRTDLYQFSQERSFIEKANLNISFTNQYANQYLKLKQCEPDKKSQLPLSNTKRSACGPVESVYTHTENDDQADEPGETDEVDETGEADDTKNESSMLDMMTQSINKENHSKY